MIYFWLAPTIWGQTIISSSSSETMAATTPVELSKFIKIELEITSSFFWSSPEVFEEPCRPRRPVKPARRTADEIDFVAVAIEFKTSVKSPVASGWNRCRERIKRVRVSGLWSLRKGNRKEMRKISGNRKEMRKISEKKFASRFARAVKNFFYRLIFATMAFLLGPLYLLWYFFVNYIGNLC